MNDDAKVDAWMPLWIGAYLADTMHLSRDSHGGYLLLLFAYWRNRGPLPDDDEDLAGITKATPAEWKKLRPRLERFFVVADGFWTHGRADVELKKAGEFKEKAIKRARAGGQARAEKLRKQAIELASSTALSSASSSASSTPEAVLQACSTPPPSPIEEQGEYSPTLRAGANSVTEGFTPTPAGVVCRALRLAGVVDVNPGHPRLLALLDAGATEAEFVGFAPMAVAKAAPFAWLLGAVEGERKRAAEGAEQMRRGPMPEAAPVTVPSREAERTAELLAAESEHAAKVAAATPEQLAQRREMLQRVRQGVLLQKVGGAP